MSERCRVLLLSNHGAHAVYEGVLAYAREAGWVMDARMLYAGGVPKGGRADGALCFRSAGSDMGDIVSKLAVPVVALDCGVGETLPCVRCRDESVGRMAAQHALERGYETLCFFGRKDSVSGARRMKGFQQAAETSMVQYVSLIPPDDGVWEASTEALCEWLQPRLSALPLPLIIMAEDDLLAVALIEALLAGGYHIPEQVAVMGAGNDPMLCDVASVPVSSVDVRPREVGYQAARYLDGLMKGESTSGLPTTIEAGPVMTRVSSDTLALPNVHAAMALRFIWTHYRNAIKVDDVAQQVSVTRRRLQTLFQEHLGRTMQEEIARVRLAAACLMLKQSTLRIRDIAEKAGFKSSLHLHRTAKSLLAMGPKAFRENGTMPDFGVLPVSVGFQRSQF